MDRGEQSILVKKCDKVDKPSGDLSCCCALDRERRQRIKQFFASIAEPNFTASKIPS